MKTAPIYSIEAKEIGRMELPAQFNEEFRPDLIRRAVLAIQNSGRQGYGSSPFAGKRASAEISKRRRHYRTCYGMGIARTPRKIISKRGRRLNWIGAFAPNTRGGRRSHPPKATRIFTQKLNTKENRKAIRSAISKASSIIIENRFEEVNKTAQTAKIINKLAFLPDAGQKPRQSKKAGARKILIVVSGECPLKRAVQNISAVCEARQINAELLAPGSNAGRSVLWTQKAIEVIAKERLYL